MVVVSERPAPSSFFWTDWQGKSRDLVVTAYGLHCGVDSYEENGLRLVSIIYSLFREVCHMMLMAQLHQ